MIALILTLTLIGSTCYLISTWISIWLGWSMLAWISFSIFWFFRTWAVKGKNGPDSLLDKIALAPMLGVSAVFGFFNYWLQERLGLP